MSCELKEELRDIKVSVRRLEKVVNKLVNLPIIQTAIERQSFENQLVYEEWFKGWCKDFDDILNNIKQMRDKNEKQGD